MLDRTHVVIHKDLKYKAKIAAAKKNISLRNWIEEAVKSKLKEKK